MPADARLQAREALAKAAEPLGLLYPELPAVSDLSDQATAKRYEALQDLLLKIKVQGLRSSGQVVVLKGVRRALGESPLDHPSPEPGPGFSRLVRATIVDPGVPVDPPFPPPVLERVDDRTFAAAAQPLRDAIAQACGDEDFEGGVA